MTQPAGKRRQRVTLLRKTRTVDADGNNQTAWAPVGLPLRCEVRGISGHEAVIGRALAGVAVFKIITRFRDDFDTSWQLGYGTLTLNIRSIVDPDGKRRNIEILADTASTQATT